MDSFYSKYVFVSFIGLTFQDFMVVNVFSFTR